MLSDLLLLVFSPLFWLVALPALLISTAVYNRYFTGISHVPGPWLASLSNIWRYQIARTFRPEQVHINLHERYGPVVRLGPNIVSVSDPSALQTIYAPNAGFVKSAFYRVQQTLSMGQPLLTLFTTLNEAAHARLRRAVSNAYAMSTLVQFEPLVDSTTSAFLEQLSKRFAVEGTVLDFGTWLQYYAFDVIGELTFSKRLGFVDGGKDIEGVIGSIERMLDYAAVVGQMPDLDYVMIKNPFRLLISKWGLWQSDTPMVRFAKARYAERYGSDGAALEKAEYNSQYRDFLSRFTEAGKKDPEFVTQRQVLALTVANIFAGSDTTAITLRAIFYHLLKHPNDLATLRAEIDKAKEADEYTRTDGMFDWNQVRQLPFLDAVIKEALRCHPAAGLTLERIVPSGGRTISGVYLPAGTIVGANAWVIHRHQGIFGPDAAQWRPQRWLEADNETKRRMENHIFSFGMGARTCIGKNISLLEMYKMVPALLNRFEIDFDRPDREWDLHNAWFVKQTGFHVRLRERASQ
ncbi:Cytochrome P450-like protein 81 [Elsinoe fawcettii]|nr:Cytochrome P450-like protein 81 [Elsinoe fawcettii]